MYAAIPLPCLRSTKKSIIWIIISYCLLEHSEGDFKTALYIIHVAMIITSQHL